MASNPPPEWPTSTSPGCISGDDRVAAIGQRRLLIDERAVAGQVDGDAVVTQLFEFGDGAVPAPRGVKTAVYEQESH